MGGAREASRRILGLMEGIAIGDKKRLPKHFRGYGLGGEGGMVYMA